MNEPKRKKKITRSNSKPMAHQLEQDPESILVNITFFERPFRNLFKPNSPTNLTR